MLTCGVEVYPCLRNVHMTTSRMGMSGAAVPIRFKSEADTRLPPLLVTSRTDLHINVGTPHRRSTPPPWCLYDITIAVFPSVGSKVTDPLRWDCGHTRALGRREWRRSGGVDSECSRSAAVRSAKVTEYAGCAHTHSCAMVHTHTTVESMLLMKLGKWEDGNVEEEEEEGEDRLASSMHRVALIVGVGRPLANED